VVNNWPFNVPGGGSIVGVGDGVIVDVGVGDTGGGGLPVITS